VSNPCYVPWATASEDGNMGYVSYFDLGQDAYYAGTNMPQGLSAEQEREWNSGWRAADRRERWRLDQAAERD
jgi:hypothetical protein